MSLGWIVASSINLCVHLFTSSARGPTDKSLTKVLFNTTAKEVPGVCVHKIHVAAFHAATEQNTIGVLDEVRKLSLGSLYDAVGAVLGHSFPGCGAWIVNEIRSKDDSDIVEFKSLSRVDATDLVYAVGIVSPKRGFGDAGR